MWHPIVWLFLQTLRYKDVTFEAPGWIVASIFLITLWVVLARFLAEVPGLKTGQMLLWWFIFAVFHIFGIIIYIILDKWARNYIAQKRFLKRLLLADRTPGQIMASPFSVSGFELPESLNEGNPNTGLFALDMSPLSSELPTDNR